MSTERDMLDALHARYAQASQGESVRWACAEHVRAHASFDAKACDFMAQDLWPSKGLHLHGHEVKVSRADWLRELAQPEKAEALRRFCDKWWLVVSDKAIVKDDLPDGWGLMVVTGGTVRVAKAAPLLTPEPHPATFRASLLRATAKTNARRGSVHATLTATIARRDAEITRLNDLLAHNRPFYDRRFTTPPGGP